MQVKICCIQSIFEAELAMHCGATAIGLVGPMPSGPGVISHEKISEIAAWCRGKIETFLLTSETRPKRIIDQYEMTRTTTIQMVDYLKPSDLVKLQEQLSIVTTVQVVHVLSKNDVVMAQQYGALADMLLLDSGNPNLTTKELGGTGQVHDWTISAQIVKAVKKPVFLAGGLSAENVGSVIKTVQPAGVDLCSSVRTHGSLDEKKLSDFMSAVRAA